MRSYLLKLLKKLVKEEFGLENLDFKVERPKEEFGDLSTNLCFILAKELKESPKEIYQRLRPRLEKDRAFEEINFLRGFINFKFSKEFLMKEFNKLLKEGKNYFKEDLGKGERVLIEYVSANPTGPLHLGHARGGVVGDVLSRLYKFLNYKVVREYYVNDWGRQIELLELSFKYHYYQLLGEEEKLKALKERYEREGYKGEYLKELARSWLGKVKEENLREKLIEHFLGEIKRDLKDLGISFDNFFYESSLYKKGLVEKVLKKLKDYLYQREGALFLRTSSFGDEKDRVVRRSSGEYTYFAGDIAYHYQKFKRGYKRTINLWGSDHHGYVARLRGALKMLGIKEDFMEVILVQTVKVFKGGKEVRMSKREGEFITLRELLEEVGKDAIRFMFLMKKSDTPLDFDLEIALKRSSENPVFYVQYAHARFCGIEREFRRKFRLREVEPTLEELKEEAKPLVKKVLFLKDELVDVAKTKNVHLLTHYLIELSKDFHRFYTKHRIITKDFKESLSNLALVRGLRITFEFLLKELLGVSAPRRM